MQKITTHLARVDILILSAEHGLINSCEVIAPYDRLLKQIELYGYRRAEGTIQP